LILEDDSQAMNTYNTSLTNKFYNKENKNVLTINFMNISKSVWWKCNICRHLSQIRDSFFDNLIKDSSIYLNNKLVNFNENEIFN